MGLVARSSQAPRLLQLVFLVLASLLQVIHADVNLTPAATSSKATNPDSHTLAPSYIGMGIEPSNVFAFVGTSSPNVLTDNLLNNLANYTGVPPHIRVGGNTQDFMVYSSTYDRYYFGANPSASSISNEYVFGPKYFQAINNLPAKTPVSLGIGMTYNGSDAIDMSVAIASQALSTLTNVNLVGLEVGNEPDLYIQNGFRPSTWTIYDYGGEWISHVQAIYEQVLKPRNIGTAFFEAACTATTANFQQYRIQNLVNTGLATNNGVYLAGWNQHDYYYYVGVSSYPLTMSILLDLSNTVGQFSEWAQQAQAAAVTGKPYYLREMGSVGPNGLQGISNTFANALWTLNFFLYAATIGVDSVQMHMLQSSYGSPWQPITDPDNAATFVRPSYYAYAAMNQIIGAKCATTVTSLELSNAPSSYNNRLAAYGVYDGGNLQSLVLLNTFVANSSTYNIGSQNFVISLPSLAGKTFYFSVLTASGADATSNVTWNGLSYEQSGHGSPSQVSGTVNSSRVGSDGTLTVNVRNSQAIVANLDSQLGTQNNVVDEAVCAALAASTAEGGASSTTSTNGAAPTFKSTSGFQSNSPLSLAAIIGIAAGGGAALVLLIIALCICCCRRRNRRRKQREIDAAALLATPTQQYKSKHGNMRKYANVPQRDSIDSSPMSDDIWMLPMGGKGGNRSRYDSASGFSTPPRIAGGSSGHSRQESYNASLNGSPLVPASPVMQMAPTPAGPDMRSYNNSGSGGMAMPASMAAANYRRSQQQQHQQQQPQQQQNASHAPHASSNLARNVEYGEDMATSPSRERHTSTPSRPVGAGGGEYARGRNQSTPSRPQQGQPGQQGHAAYQQRSSRHQYQQHGGDPADYSASASRRAPSAPAPNARSLPGSRNPSPGPRATQSSHGHGYNHYRSSGYDDSIPPVPPLPMPQSSVSSQGHGGYRQSYQADSVPAGPPPPMPNFLHHASQVSGPRSQPPPSDAHRRSMQYQRAESVAPPQPHRLSVQHSNHHSQQQQQQQGQYSQSYHGHSQNAQDNNSYSQPAWQNDGYSSYH